MLVYKSLCITEHEILLRFQAVNNGYDKCHYSLLMKHAPRSAKQDLQNFNHELRAWWHSEIKSKNVRSYPTLYIREAWIKRHLCFVPYQREPKWSSNH